MLHWLYRDARTAVAGEGTTYPIKAAGTLWIYAAAATEAEAAAVSRDFKIPLRYLKNFQKEKRSVRYSFKPLLCTFVDYTIESGKIRRLNIFYALTKNQLITFLESPIVLYDELFEQAKAMPSAEAVTPTALMTQVLDEDINENYGVLELSENQITELQKKLTTRAGIEETVSRIIELRRTLDRMSRAFWGSSRITYALRRGLTEFKLTEDEKKRVDDLHDALIYQIDIISSQKDMLTDAVIIYQTTISNTLAGISNSINTSIRRLTWVMLLLTGAALVITIPNTVATVFGIPGLFNGNWPLVAGLLFLATLIPVLWFANYWRKIRREAEETIDKNNR